ncbi:MAG: hypothetical protein P1U88_05970 [Thalassobaculaceae bacterium]|nr:hypothetical protein [Thalassobaculaceae bacterium]
MRDFSLVDPPAGPKPERRPEGILLNYRLRELERRVGRIEAFLLGVLCTIALSVVGGLAALLNLPGP